MIGPLILRVHIDTLPVQRAFEGVATAARALGEALGKLSPFFPEQSGSAILIASKRRRRRLRGKLKGALRKLARQRPQFELEQES